MVLKYIEIILNIKDVFQKEKKKELVHKKGMIVHFIKESRKIVNFIVMGFIKFADGSEYRRHLFRIFLEAWKLLKKYKASKFLCMEAYIKNGIFIKI